MCQYSSIDGLPNDWHFVHLGQFATGGAALVMTEAAAVAAVGRISPADAGIWDNAQVDGWRKITQFLKEHDSVPAIQLAHAGWKASTAPPWAGGKAVASDQGGWQPVGVGNVPFVDGYPTPHALTEAGIDEVCRQFIDGARRAVAAGFEVIELHAAHGYLFHSFLSPLANHRTDSYGGSFENRTRLLLRAVRDVRAALPSDLPLLVRLSCSDWTEGGWVIDDSVRLSIDLKNAGVDLIDCSSGGAVPRAHIPTSPGYQLPFAAAIKKQAGIATAAVGMITEPKQAEDIIATGQADMVFLARELLRDPHFPARAAKELGVKSDEVAPKQYARAW